MYVIANLHNDRVDSEVTYLALDTLRGRYFFSSLQNARMFGSSDEAESFWNNCFPDNVLCNPKDTYVIYHIYLVKAADLTSLAR